MREAIEAWEAEGGGLREITEGAAKPSVVVHRSRPVSTEKRMIGTANQVDWAERIRGQVSEEFDRVAMALESAMSHKQAEQKRGRLSPQSQSSRTSGAKSWLRIRLAISFVSGTRCAIRCAS